MRADRTSPTRSTLAPAATAQSALVVAIVAWGALSFGAVYRWGWGPLAGAAIVAGMIGVVVDRGRRVPAGVAVALAALIVAVVLQIIPLPRPILARISPASIGLLAQYDVAFALGPQAAGHSLSVDPHRTLIGLCLLASLGIFWLGLTAMLHERLILRIVRSVIVVGLGVAVIGLIAPAGYNERVYGFWQPQFPASPFGPFVNRNHFAGWMLMTIPLGCGYMLSLMARAIADGDRSWRARLVWLSTRSANRLILLGCVLTVLVLSVLLSLSRSGIVCLTLGLMTFGYATSGRFVGGSRRAIVAGCLALVTIGCVGWAGPDKIGARFEEFRTDSWGHRAQIWRDASSVVRMFPVAGTGLDTFGVAMLFYQTTHLEELYAEAHSDYLQLAAEGGVLVGVPVLALILVTTREVRRRFREPGDTVTTHWLRTGAVAGLLMMALQETSEFSLQLPGNAALFCVLAAIAIHRSDRTGVAPGRPASVG